MADILSALIKVVHVLGRLWAAILCLKLQANWDCRAFLHCSFDSTITGTEMTWIPVGFSTHRTFLKFSEWTYESHAQIHTHVMLDVLHSCVLSNLSLHSMESENILSGW